VTRIERVLKELDDLREFWLEVHRCRMPKTDQAETNRAMRDRPEKQREPDGSARE
jgi:hypothetical protein